MNRQYRGAPLPASFSSKITETFFVENGLRYSALSYQKEKPAYLKGPF